MKILFQREINQNNKQNIRNNPNKKWLHQNILNDKNVTV